MNLPIQAEATAMARRLKIFVWLQDSIVCIQYAKTFEVRFEICRLVYFTEV